MKLVGLGSAFNQLLLQPYPSSVALGVSALLVGGGTISKDLIIALLDRLMGFHEPPPPPPPSQGPEK